jgi:hypothetical protein
MFRDTTLRRARLTAGLTIDEVAARTRLSPRLVILLDEGRFQELPGGLYARSYVRAFATAVAMDPDVALSRLEQMLPGTADPLDALRGSLGHLDPEKRPVVADLQRVWESIAAKAKISIAQTAVARTLVRPTPLPIVARRSAAAVFDTALIVAINALILRTVASLCGIGVSALVEANGGAVATFCAITMMLYYVFLAGIGGRTAGSWLCKSRPPAQVARLRPAAILVRAWHTWLEQASIVVDVAMYADPAPVKSLLSRLDVIRHRAA